MTEYQITCVVQDSNGIITSVGINGQTYTVITVVNWILNRTHTFFTMKNGYRAQVYAKQHPTTKRWFLTTEPDGTRENNLDFLPHCM